jgi:hypothetical protein
MDLAALENLRRAGRCGYRGWTDRASTDVLGEKGIKVGEGTFANVYKGRSMGMHS